MEMLAQNQMPFLKESSSQIAVRTAIIRMQGGIHFLICKNKEPLDFSLRDIYCGTVAV